MAQAQHDTHAMQRAAGQVNQAFESIAAIQKNLDTSAANLLKGWQGQSAQAFQNVYTDFNDNLIAIMKSLEGIEAKLGESGATYVKTEDAQLQAAKQVKVSGTSNIASLLNR